MENKKKASFYEGLFIIQCFWTLITVCLLIAFTVYAILYNDYWYVPFIILLGFILITAFSYLLGKTCLRKVTIDENGITLNRNKITSFYSWSEICTADIKIIKFRDTIFSYDFFLWLFRMS
ncbi:hypothetical protein, partial [Chryseobacterium sp.]|uniref:hypothetical protein n=1 Tax=Chryseobacterium sp. TaxID=1871047 RepID=UPI002FCBC0A0